MINLVIKLLKLSGQNFFHSIYKHHLARSILILDKEIINFVLRGIALGKKIKKEIYKRSCFGCFLCYEGERQ